MVLGQLLPCFGLQGVDKPENRINWQPVGLPRPALPHVHPLGTQGRWAPPGRKPAGNQLTPSSPFGSVYGCASPVCKHHLPTVKVAHTTYTRWKVPVGEVLRAER